MTVSKREQLRAQLRGSDELFRATGNSTSTTSDAQTNGSKSAAVQAAIELAPKNPSSMGNQPKPIQDGTLLARFSVHELQVFAEGVQRLKFPDKIMARPSVDEFEHLEELRQKLLDLLP